LNQAISVLLDSLASNLLSLVVFDRQVALDHLLFDNLVFHQDHKSPIRRVKALHQVVELFVGLGIGCDLASQTCD
jgi:hypothetical protein